MQRELTRHLRRVAQKEETIRDFVAWNLGHHLSINMMASVYAGDTTRKHLNRLHAFGVDLTRDVLRDRVVSAGELAQSLVARVGIKLLQLFCIPFVPTEYQYIAWGAFACSRTLTAL